MALTDSLAAHWRLDEASGTRVDASGNGRDMSANGSPGNRAGKIGSALDVAVVTGAGTYCYYTDSGNALDCPAGASLTAACWVYLDALPGGSGFGYPLNRWGVTGDWAIRLSSTGIVACTMRQTGSNALAVTPGSTIASGAWYFIVGWFDHTAGANGTAYVQVNDGTVYSAALTSAKVAESGAAVSAGDLGHTPVAFGDLDGAIDSASVWTRVLTADERTALYNGGAGLDYPFTVSRPLMMQHHHAMLAGGRR